MRIDTTHTLQDVLKDHSLWLSNNGGSRADLSGADLSRASLFGADLSRASLFGADLSGADLSEANLTGANLYRANLTGANLYSAYLFGADLSGANLFGANLSGADLSEANLTGANLDRAYLFGADLSEADLKEIKNLNLSKLVIVPESGSFTGYKKSREGVIIQLEITEESKRLNAIGSRKCRASQVKIVKFLNSDKKILRSQYDGTFTYEVGQIITIEDFNESLTIECGSGIHFFLTQQEAKDY